MLILGIVCGIPAVLIIWLSVEQYRYQNGLISPDGAAEKLAKKYHLTGAKKRSFYKLAIRMGDVVDKDLYSSLGSLEAATFSFRSTETQSQWPKAQSQMIKLIDETEKDPGIRMASSEYLNVRLKPLYRKLNL